MLNLSFAAPDSIAPGFLKSRFTPALEREFAGSYYAHIRPTLRLAAGFLTVLCALYVWRDFADTRSAALSLSTAAPMLFFALVLGLSFVPSFERWWKWFVVAGGIAATGAALRGQASFMAAHHPTAMGSDYLGTAALFFGQQMRVYMICLALFRLPFRYALGLQSAILAMGLALYWSEILGGAPGLENLSRFLQYTLPFMGALLLGAYVEEKLARGGFLANHELAQLQAEEHERLVKTEGMLHVLNNSIGGIVHDLGNPLTSVQMGAQTLDLCLEHDAADAETLREISGAIAQGGQMLGFLRLSLIEQTRVLEGKATPVELKPTRVASVVELGAKFQKPNVSFGRKIEINGEETLVCADEMKLATVFMNLIGNALKYSDGQVKVCWRRAQNEPILLLAVCDQGTGGRGLTRQSAAQLFTAFGRLEIHQAVEGTGLGLLSIRNIIAAHGGHSWIEGFEDGAPDSAPFSTGEGKAGEFLGGDFRTAFVVSCPLA